MSFGLLREWIYSPIENDRLLKNFIKQDFLSQFSGSIGGILWVFATPIITILIYSFVFGYVFQLRALPEFGETEFVIFMMIGYLPWIAFADSIGKSTGLLIDKAGLITKVAFPVHILPVVCTLISFFTHLIGFSILLIYLAWAGYFSIYWLLIPIIYLLQFVFTLGIVAVISALCVFLRDMQNLVSLCLTIWFFLTPIIYPISLIENSAVRRLSARRLKLPSRPQKEPLLLNAADVSTFMTAAADRHELLSKKLERVSESRQITNEKLLRLLRSYLDDKLEG